MKSMSIRLTSILIIFAMAFTLVCCTRVSDVNDTTTEAETVRKGQSTEAIENSESAKTTEAVLVTTEKTSDESTEKTSDESTETNVASEYISEAATNPPAEITTEESMRLCVASTHWPASLKYSGNMEVLWKPSGATPSMGASATQTSGAFLNFSSVKSGAWY